MSIRRRRALHLFVAPMAAALLWGCQTAQYAGDIPPLDYEDEPLTTDVEVSHRSINWQLVASQPPPSSSTALPTDWGEIYTSYRYRLGVGDRLAFSVWNHPEYSISHNVFTDTRSRIGGRAGREHSAPPPGQSSLIIGRDGHIQLPHVEPVKVVGLTVEEARTVLAEKLSIVIEDPLVYLGIVGFNSQYAFIINTDGAYQELRITDHPLTLPRAIIESGLARGGIVRRVTLTRDGATRNVDLHRILVDGQLSEEWILRHGDVVRIPPGFENTVRLFGEFRGNRAIAVPLGGISLGRILAEGGLSNGADYSTIHVIRDESDRSRTSTDLANPRQLPTHIGIYTLDVRNFDAQFIAEGFRMQPGDYVVAPTAPIYRWNSLINSLLPSYGFLGNTDGFINRLRDLEEQLR